MPNATPCATSSLRRAARAFWRARWAAAASWLLRPLPMLVPLLLLLLPLLLLLLLLLLVADDTDADALFAFVLLANAVRPHFSQCG